MECSTAVFLTPAGATERYAKLFTDYRASLNMDEVAQLGNLCVEKAEHEFCHLLGAAEALLDAGLPTNPTDLEQLRDEAAKGCGLAETTTLLDKSMDRKLRSEADKVALTERLKSDPSIAALPLARQIDHMVHKFLFIHLSSRLSTARFVEDKVRFLEQSQVRV